MHEAGLHLRPQTDIRRTGAVDLVPSSRPPLALSLATLSLGLQLWIFFHTRSTHLRPVR